MPVERKNEQTNVTYTEPNENGLVQALREDFKFPLNDKIAVPKHKTSAPAYISKVNLRLGAVSTQKHPAQQSILLPANLPLFAPGFPGDSND